MSNWNKVNSEMYSLTDGPYHCIVRESGQMYYCEVFRNDDLIFSSTYEDLESAKIDCEIKVLAGRFKAGLFSPVVFDFKDTGGKEEILNSLSRQALRFKKQLESLPESGKKGYAVKLPKGWYLSADGKEYKRKLGDYTAVVTPLSDDRAFLSVIQHSKGSLTCLVRFDGKAVLYRDTLEESIKIANSRLESTYESDCSNDKKDCSGYFTSSEGGVGFLLGKHFETIDRYKERVAETHAQAAKAVEDWCKAAAEQEPKRKFNWAFIAADYYCLLTDEFHVSVFTALDKWNLRIIERPSNIMVINSTLDKCEDAKKMAEAFLEGYYEGPEVKEEPKTKNPSPFAVVEGWNIFVFRGRTPLSKKPSSWCFRAEKENSYATYCDFESEDEAKAAALEWVRSFSYGCVDIEQPNPTEVEETVIAQIRKRRDVGREKYGTTMEREDLSFIQWLQHLQEELLDAAIYAEKLKREHRKELLSDMIVDDENSGLYD